VDLELGKWLATLGVGGSIAGVVLYFYHRLAESHEKNWRDITERWEAMTESMNLVVKENTAAFTQCMSAIQHMQRQLERWDGQDRRMVERRAR
jgi:hypothetical protein